MLNMPQGQTVVIVVSANSSVPERPSVVDLSRVRLRVSAPASPVAVDEYTDCIVSRNCIAAAAPLLLEPDLANGVTTAFNLCANAGAGFCKWIYGRYSSMPISAFSAFLFQLIFNDPNFFVDSFHAMRGPRSDTVGQAMMMFLGSGAVRAIMSCMGPCSGSAVFDSTMMCPEGITLVVAADEPAAVVPMPAVDRAAFSDAHFLLMMGADATLATEGNWSNRCLEQGGGRYIPNVGGDDGTGSPLLDAGCGIWRSDGAATFWAPIQVNRPLTVGVVSTITFDDGVRVVATCNTTISVERSPPAHAPAGKSWTTELFDANTWNSGVRIAASNHFLALSGDGRTLFTAGRSASGQCVLAALHAATGSILWRSASIDACGSGVRFLAAPKLGDTIAILTWANAVSLFSAATGAPRGTLVMPHDDGFIGTATEINGTQLYIPQFEMESAESGSGSDVQSTMLDRVQAMFSLFSRQQLPYVRYMLFKLDFRDPNNCTWEVFAPEVLGECRGGARMATYHGDTGEHTDILVVHCRIVYVPSDGEPAFRVDLIALNGTTGDVVWRRPWGVPGLSHDSWKTAHVLWNGTDDSSDGVQIVVTDQQIRGPMRFISHDIASGLVVAESSLSGVPNVGTYNGSVDQGAWVSRRHGLFYQLYPSPDGEGDEQRQFNSTLVAVDLQTFQLRFATTTLITGTPRILSPGVPTSERMYRRGCGDSVVVNDRLGLLFVVLDDSRVLSLDLLTGLASEQWGYKDAMLDATQVGDKAMLTALASDEQTGRIYTIDARRRVNGIGTGPGTSCYATTMSASTPTGTRWRWPATAASPFEFQDVTGWVPADATAAMRASHDTCQLVEAAGRDVSRRSCRGYDSTFPPADDWANGLFCDAMPDGGDSVLADIRSGMTVITASQVAGTRDGGGLSFCSVQINVTEVSVVPVTILSVVTGRQTSRRVLFSDLLLNSTGAVVMAAQAVGDLCTSLRLRYSGALTIVAGPSPETGVAEWIEVSGVFNSVIR